MSFSRLLRDSVKILSSGSERVRKTDKGKGREAMIQDIRGKLKYLEKVEQFQ